ncbi:MAG: ribonuclease HII [Bacteroidales bacterium]|nr:ribonuclease HII [Bacteroidales bacterium]
MLLPYCQKGRLEAGCDEAGRGCLAGPVYAAAVILPEDFCCEELNDSKQLTEKQRYALRPLIEQSALAWAVGVVSAAEIDRINILNASLLAMHRAVAQLQLRPQHLLIDGNRFRRPCQLPLHLLSEDKKQPPTPALSGLPEDYPDIPATTVVKGDGKYLSIAAASVLAKTYRDDCMATLHRECPAYHWDENKGYPTAAHREAIRQLGPSPWHRMSFRLLDEDEQLSLF